MQSGTDQRRAWYRSRRRPDQRSVVRAAPQRRPTGRQHDQRYLEAVASSTPSWPSTGCPATVAAIRREHVEAFIEDQLARSEPASAANRYRCLQQFFRWLVDEGEINESPMARMNPPTSRRLPHRSSATDRSPRSSRRPPAPFDDRRDRAIIELLY